MVTVLIGGNAEQIADAKGGNGELWVPAAAVERVTGWSLRAEGFCRDDVCVPVSDTARAAIVGDGAIDLATLWRHLGRPVLHDAAGETWVLGDSAGERAAQLESLEAPDFELPDLSGRLHRLSQFRGRKVLLATWASW